MLASRSADGGRDALIYGARSRPSTVDATHDGAQHLVDFAGHHDRALWPQELLACPATCRRSMGRVGLPCAVA